MLISLVAYQNMASIFSKIIAGEIPCHKIAETEEFFAFLDVFPCAMGHTLVVPKQEIDYLFALNDELYTGLMAFAKQIEPAIRQAVPCKRVGVAVIGLEVPHAHVHLIPMNSLSDMNFNQKLKPSQEALAETAANIRSFLK
jgi:histidine triad (HIT) family protein